MKKVQTTYILSMPRTFDMKTSIDRVLEVEPHNKFDITYYVNLFDATYIIAIALLKQEGIFSENFIVPTSAETRYDSKKGCITSPIALKIWKYSICKNSIEFANLLLNKVEDIKKGYI